MVLKSFGVTHLKQRDCTQPVSEAEAALGGSPMREGDDRVMHAPGWAAQSDLLTVLVEPVPGAPGRGVSTLSGAVPSGCAHCCCVVAFRSQGLLGMPPHRVLRLV